MNGVSVRAGKTLCWFTRQSDPVGVKYANDSSVMSRNLEHCWLNLGVWNRRSVSGKYYSVSHLCAVNSTKDHGHLTAPLNSYKL